MAKYNPQILGGIELDTLEKALADVHSVMPGISKEFNDNFTDEFKLKMSIPYCIKKQKLF